MKLILLTTTLSALMVSIRLVSCQFLPSSHHESSEIDAMSAYQSPLSRLVQSTANLYRSPLSRLTGGSSALHSSSSYHEDEPSSFDSPPPPPPGGATDQSNYYNQQQQMQRSPSHNRGYYGGASGFNPAQQPQPQSAYGEAQGGFGSHGSNGSPMIGSSNMRPSSSGSGSSSNDDEDRDDDELPNNYGPASSDNQQAMYNQQQAGNPYGNGQNAGYFPTGNGEGAMGAMGGMNGVGPMGQQQASNSYYQQQGNFQAGPPNPYASGSNMGPSSPNDDEGTDEDDSPPMGAGAQGSNGGGARDTGTLNQAASYQGAQPYGMAGAASGYGGGFGSPSAAFGFDLTAYNPYYQSGYGTSGYGVEGQADQSGGHGGRHAKATSAGYGMAYGNANAYGGQPNSGAQNGNRQRDPDSYDNDNDSDDD